MEGTEYSDYTPEMDTRYDFPPKKQKNDYVIIWVLFGGSIIFFSCILIGSLVKLF